jgi:hypothetical protein
LNRRLIALALLAFCFIQLPARTAQSSTAITAQPLHPNEDEIIPLTLSVLAGLARGQTMRFTLFNPGEPDSQLSPRTPLRAQVKLFDAEGRVIAESEEVAIPPGAFRSFDFNRRDIPLAGEAGTGRLQVRGTFRALERRDVSEARGHQIPASVELVNNDTGATGDIRTIISAEAALTPVNRDFY